jgi:hypothetical protein
VLISPDATLFAPPPIVPQEQLAVFPLPPDIVVFDADATLPSPPPITLAIPETVLQ